MILRDCHEIACDATQEWDLFGDNVKARAGLSASSIRRKLGRLFSLGIRYKLVTR